ncbi:MAG: hypothetical protein AAF950_04880 [Pseudomonadota bacterium]
MVAAVESGVKTPWHLWAVGVLSALWNSYGCYDFAMIQTSNKEYLAAFSAEQIAHVNAYPIWMDLAWTLGVWGAIAGSALLLLRRRFAMPVFGASFAGLIVSIVYNYGLTEGGALSGTQGLIISGVLVAVALALFLYARSMAKRGVLA